MRASKGQRDRLVGRRRWYHAEESQGKLSDPRKGGRRGAGSKEPMLGGRLVVRGGVWGGGRDLAPKGLGWEVWARERLEEED